MAKVATEKQINYALNLLARQGYPTDQLTDAHDVLWGVMNQPGVDVRFYLAGMAAFELATTIDVLKGRWS